MKVIFFERKPSIYWLFEVNKSTEFFFNDYFLFILKFF